MLNFYISRDNRKEVENCKHILDRYSPVELVSNAKVVKGKYHLKYGDRDSTAFYWKLVFDSPQDIYVRHNASYHLFEYYKERGDIATANFYASAYMAAQDSIYGITRERQTANAYNEYIYQKDVEAEVRLREDAWRTKLYSLLCACIVLAVCLLVCLLAYFQRLHLLRKNRELAANAENMADRLHRERSLRTQIDLTTSEVCTALRGYASSNRRHGSPSTLFRQLFAVVDKYYSEFGISLKPLLPGLKERDLYLLYMLRAGLSKSEVARVLGVDRSTVTRYMNLWCTQAPQLPELLKSEKK